MTVEKPFKTSEELQWFLDTLSECENLSSLSLPPIGKPNWELFTQFCQTSGLKDKLKRLDVCHEDYHNWGTLSFDFPNLTELRLAKRDARFKYRNAGLPDRSNGSSWINKDDRWKFLAVSTITEICCDSHG